MSRHWQYTQRWCFIYISMLGLMILGNTAVKAQEESVSSAPSIAYIAIEPDIVTNYAGDNSDRLGFLRITIEMMLDEPSLIPEVEHHMPLLRATAIEVIGAQPEQKIKSLTGREEMRRLILKRFRDIMVRETGEETVRDIIFTKYLRQGG
uniref:flagellar basal body-associated FliL family protein n=1 Tax=Ningiella ruwaisensis TaxID=2364274 RepID=UPI001F4F69A9|nr:flagellar basal body-associated FliL family protein [Ningiella ruwaisensis]